MSNTLTNLVPNFNGKDFKSYAKKMEAYLVFQGIDYVLTEDKPSPVKSTKDTPGNEEELKQFDVNDGIYAYHKDGAEELAVILGQSVQVDETA
ncbi:hypothetical protein GGF50DRAFT_120979 [Schizophyllum commune]